MSWSRGNSVSLEGSITTEVCKLARRARLQFDRLEERTLLSTFTVINADDNGDDLNPLAGSLRAAIRDANVHDNSLNPGGVRDIISFAISGAAPHIRFSRQRACPTSRRP